MGLTNHSVGKNALRSSLLSFQSHSDEKLIALAGNPNVGKSTIFNALTGMNQHTGNWPGKTVATACGHCRSERHAYCIIDLPGTYSLSAHSPEEEVARDFLCMGQADAIVVVCDVTCLERNLNLALQILEISSNVILCVNFMDEARKKNISVSIDGLSRLMGIPVIGVSGHHPETLSPLLFALDRQTEQRHPSHPAVIRYPAAVEQAILQLEPLVEEKTGGLVSSRWISLKLLQKENTFLKSLDKETGTSIYDDQELLRGAALSLRRLLPRLPENQTLDDVIVSTLMNRAENICRQTITFHDKAYHKRDFAIDRIITSPWIGFPLMLLLLLFLFWITIVGANYPSELLSSLLFGFQDTLTVFFQNIHAPDWLHGLFVLGIYRVVAWVVSVMLPPMAIFFPLFTLLEDSGFLPRIAYNLDRPFQCCRSCGKQALTMCMGFGCNAAGVVGCRIIDSPRERLLAILTNSLVPCNGRFPALITLITMFFAGNAVGLFSSFSSAFLLTLFLLLSILMTFAATKFLSSTVLKGTPSSFLLELPPYRRPQIGKVIVRSVMDRTLFVLGRAILSAAPAGMLLWIFGNVTINGDNLLSLCSGTLDPFARIMGLDGVILLAFLLGFPANEIIIPIILMAYLSGGTLVEMGSLTEFHQLLVANGWTMTTALCTLVFFLFHWPCATTLLTIKKETGNWKWTALAALLPTALGVGLCVCIQWISCHLL
ncbi:MAG: ferrous iron transport protein B [Eubacteriales bacterium]|nr:ferrous iron transport protein B [Eubacteriales bacterium]